jgi:hypothetical protein
MYYDKQGHSLTIEEFLPLFQDTEYRRVAWTELPDSNYISTVWMGIDHQFGDGPPLIFETRYQGPDGEEEQWRYSTEAEAIEGHNRAAGRYVRGELDKLHELVELGNRFKLMMEE